MTTTSIRSATEEKALNLLGSGLTPEVVANAVGVSVSRISQLLSQPEFSAAVTELRVQSLQKHNARDNTYDELEDKVLSQLKNALPMVHRPLELTRILSVLNTAKRRGQSSTDSIHESKTVVTINMPTKIIQRFTTNTHNQVIQAGNQSLLTIQSSSMKDLAALTVPPSQLKEIPNDS